MAQELHRRAHPSFWQCSHFDQSAWVASQTFCPSFGCVCGRNEVDPEDRLRVEWLFEGQGLQRLVRRNTPTLRSR